MKELNSKEKIVKKYGVIGEELFFLFFDYDKINISYTPGEYRTVSLDTCCRIVQELYRTNLDFHLSEKFAEKSRLSRRQLMYGMNLLEEMGVLSRDLVNKESPTYIKYVEDKAVVMKKPKVYKIILSFLKELKDNFESNWKKIKALKKVYSNKFDTLCSAMSFSSSVSNGKKGHRERFLNPDTGEFSISVSRDREKWYDIYSKSGGKIGTWVLNFIKGRDLNSEAQEVFDEHQNYKAIFVI